MYLYLLLFMSQQTLACRLSSMFMTCLLLRHFWVACCLADWLRGLMQGFCWCFVSLFGQVEYHVKCWLPTEEFQKCWCMHIEEIWGNQSRHIYELVLSKSSPWHVCLSPLNADDFAIQIGTSQPVMFKKQS